MKDALPDSATSHLHVKHVSVPKPARLQSTRLLQEQTRAWHSTLLPRVIWPAICRRLLLKPVCLRIASGAAPDAPKPTCSLGGSIRPLQATPKIKLHSCAANISGPSSSAVPKYCHKIVTTVPSCNRRYFRTAACAQRKAECQYR